MKQIKGGITKVKGFSALGKFIGIKKKSKKKDFAVVYSSEVCNAAGVFTKNEVKGAPLVVTKKHLADGKAQAVVINSGIANVCTGKKGIKDAEYMAKLTAKELGIEQKNVLVASTGLIGAYLPINLIKGGIKGIKKQLSKKGDIAKAILTTDTIKKEIAVKIGRITIGAVAKGAGMIHPNMATMLCFIGTDAEFSSGELKKMLKTAVDKSFNMTSVDYDTSTSDMAILMANGLAGKANKSQFQKALDFVCIELAKKIAIDGEGATKLIEAKVKNAKNEKKAEVIAKSIISSNLVKTAMFGNDPNWGRIMAAVGYSGVKISQNKIDIYFNNNKIVSNGVGVKFELKKVVKEMKKDKLLIVVDLKEGKGMATAYGCDLTYEYIKINAAYHT
ncbi:bifunctional glutamate N-acetyltransferase/amino-acid acetyltransferase ArgJ [Candidatus Woesearchaeota archaeon]|nr:bifunctional glutamate N-acetyltransferase/amino-acid acetyltransferase ArgJ [Candidatus Woesearchaeota archaeon]